VQQQRRDVREAVQAAAVWSKAARRSRAQPAAATVEAVEPADPDVAPLNEAEADAAPQAAAGAAAAMPPAQEHAAAAADGEDRLPDEVVAELLRRQRYSTHEPSNTAMNQRCPAQYFVHLHQNI